MKLDFKTEFYEDKIVGIFILFPGRIFEKRCIPGIQHDTEKRPNTTYINRQSEIMVSCLGNKPIMDYIVENEIRFARAYTTNPVCVLNSINIRTGRFSGYFTGKNKNLEREISN